MNTNLIIDGNYILYKNMFSLIKDNLLYGALYRSLEQSIDQYRTMYPFSNVYFVSDSREKSWRKDSYPEYKENRKKDESIDWDFIYDTYEEFKINIGSKKNIKILEGSRIEGDDWISYIMDKSNKNGESTIVITNDYDIKQLLKFTLDPLIINIMLNEVYGKEKLFIVNNYQIFLNKLSNCISDDIFDMNNNGTFLALINNLISKYDLKEVDPVDSLVIKLISGDSGDNISSVYKKEGKDGKFRGIAETGAKTILEKYSEEFGEVSLSDPDLYDNIADLICEQKKLTSEYIDIIKDNLGRNMSLINLDIKNIPDSIIKNMDSIFEKLK